MRDELFDYCFMLGLAFVYFVLTLFIGVFWSVYTRTLLMSPDVLNLLPATVLILAPFVIGGFLLSFVSKSLTKPGRRGIKRLILGLFSVLFVALTALSLMIFIEDTNALHASPRTWYPTNLDQLIWLWFSSFFSGLAVMFVTWLFYSCSPKVYSANNCEPITDN